MEQTSFNYWRSLGLSVRTANGLVHAGINSVEAAQNIDDKTLHLEGHHIGKLTLQQIRKVVPHTPQPSARVTAPHVSLPRHSRPMTITRDAAMFQMRQAGQNTAQIAEAFGMGREAVYDALNRHLIRTAGKPLGRRGKQPCIPLSCIECGNPFMGKTHRAALCSVQCADAGDMRKRGKHNGTTKAVRAERNAEIAQADPGKTKRSRK
jgi:hypothetical protein